MTILPFSPCRQNLVEVLIGLLDGDDALSLNVASDWLNISRTKLILAPEVLLTEDEIDFVQDRILKLKAGQPLAYVEGKASFMGFDFVCDFRVLIPRMDSESVVELALSSLPSSVQNPRVLDLCTGSGCLLLSMLKLLPNAQGVGTDHSREALNCAEQNAKSLNVKNRVKFYEEDIFQPYLELPLFDLIKPNQALFYLNEGLIYNRKRFKIYIDHLEGKTIQIDDDIYKLSKDSAMWGSLMVGIMPNMRSSLDWADRLMQVFIDTVPAHTIEPFSLAESLLKKYKMTEGKKYVSLYST